MTQEQQQSEEGVQLAQQIYQAKQFLDPELIQDAKKYYSRVSRLANSRLIQDAAKKQGIETKDSWKIRNKMISLQNLFPVQRCMTSFLKITKREHRSVGKLYKRLDAAKRNARYYVLV